MRSTGKAVMVSGGGRGLGRAIATKLALEGWRVGLLARTVTELQEAASSIKDEGGVAQAFPADVLDEDAVRRAVTDFQDWSDTPQCISLVCGAGRLRGIGPVGVVDIPSWWLDLEVALKGTFQLISAALPMLKQAEAASISVLIGPGHQGELAHASGYGAGQAGLTRLVETLAKELQPARISIFAVNPGLVPTPLMQHLLDSPEGRRWLPRFTEAFAEGKEVGPEVVAEMVAWLSTRRPQELSGRVVSAMITPEILETRLSRIQAEGTGALRLV